MKEETRICSSENENSKIKTEVKQESYSDDETQFCLLNPEIEIKDERLEDPQDDDETQFCLLNPEVEIKDEHLEDPQDEVKHESFSDDKTQFCLLNSEVEIKDDPFEDPQDEVKHGSSSDDETPFCLVNTALEIKDEPFENLQEDTKLDDVDQDNLSLNKELVSSTCDEQSYKKCEVCLSYISLPEYGEHTISHRDNMLFKYIKTAESKEMIQKQKHIVLCDICSKFYAKKHYNSHRLQHTVSSTCDEQLYTKCGVCLSYISLPQYVEHRISHRDDVLCKYNKTAEGEETIQKQKPKVLCDICGGFYAKKHYYLHKLQHSDEKSFQCTICLESFVLKEFLRSHMKSHDLPSKQYICDICGKEYKTRTGLYRHTMTHGERKINCTLCNMKFHTNSILKTHLLVRHI